MFILQADICIVKCILTPKLVFCFVLFLLVMLVEVRKIKMKCLRKLQFRFICHGHLDVAADFFLFPFQLVQRAWRPLLLQWTMMPFSYVV